MKSPEEMERALKRLVPPPLSEQAHADVSAMLASLAASAESAAPVVRDISSPTLPWYRRVPVSVAAALVIGLVSAGMWQAFSDGTQQTIAAAPLSPAPTVTNSENDAAPVLIDRMSVTDGMTVEGTLTAADGSIIHEVKRRVQTRERYRDAKKGYLITISETRDEKLYTPKKGF